MEAACCDLMMGLKFPALTHLPCEECTIAITIKIIMIIILKLLIIIIKLLLLLLLIIILMIESLSRSGLSH